MSWATEVQGAQALYDPPALPRATAPLAPCRHGSGEYSSRSDRVSPRRCIPTDARRGAGKTGRHETMEQPRGPGERDAPQRHPLQRLEAARRTGGGHPLGGTEARLQTATPSEDGMQAGPRTPGPRPRQREPAGCGLAGVESRGAGPARPDRGAGSGRTADRPDGCEEPSSPTTVGISDNGQRFTTLPPTR